MSGPIVPPLEVTEVDGSPDGRPITKIIVSNGDLSISGRTATIDTSGSGGSPATPKDAIQFNSDPAGTFTADAGFVMSVIGGGSSTVTQTGNILTGGNKIATASTNGSINIICDGTGEIFLQSENDQGGTWTDSIVNVMCNANTDDAQLKFRDSANTDNASITLDGSGHMILNNNVAAKDIDLKVLTTGQVEVANQTTDTDTVLSIMGNGTGAPRIDMQNASKRVWIECQTNKKLTVQGGAAGNTFVFDVSSATGGITFPDATTLVSAEGTAILATGVTDGYVLTADGAGASAWEAAGGGGATDLSGLSDVLIDATNFTDGLLIQPNSNGSAPTTGTLSTANYNIGIGASTFSLLTTGDQNVAIGNAAGRDMTTSNYQVAIGADAMLNVTGGSNSVAIGREALDGATEAFSDVAVGAGALGSGDYASTGGNVAIGRSACGGTTTGVRNVGVGENCCKQKAGNYNIALGYRSGYGFEDQDNCIAIGRHSQYNCEGAGNIAIGYYSGDNITTGTNNVVIGTADVPTADGDDQLSISNGADGTVIWVVGDSAGSCYQGDNAATWSTTSDQRLKREIVDSVTGLDAINAVRVRNFRYIEKAEPIMETQIDEDEEHERIVGYDGENHYHLDPEPLRVGVIAQEVQDVFPEAVTENAHGHLTVNTDSINWALLKAVQELSAKVEALEASQ